MDEEVNLFKGQRMCVICQEREKTVLLMPCRHLCLCNACGSVENHRIKNCPLCRREIVSKLDVYA